MLRLLLGQAIYTWPTKSINKQKEPKTVASIDLNENKPEQKVKYTQSTPKIYCGSPNKAGYVHVELRQRELTAL